MCVNKSHYRTLDEHIHSSAQNPPFFFSCTGAAVNNTPDLVGGRRSISCGSLRPSGV